MVIRKKTALPVLLALLVGGLALGWHKAGRVSLEPVKSQAPLQRYYAGRFSIGLPADLKLDSGRVRLLCPGPLGTVSVYETPHQDYGPVAYEALSITLPSGASHYLIADLSERFGRPAQLIHSDPGPESALVSVLIDYGPGTLRLSRPTESDGQGGYASRSFVESALRFSQNYRWGRNGFKNGDLHSLYGRVTPEQACIGYQALIRFVSSENSIRFILTNDHDPGRVAGENRMRPALADGGPPVGLSAVYKDGHWIRRVRGGPRAISGQTGLEWIVLSRDFSDGSKTFEAIWRPDNPEQPTLLMSADQANAALALGCWNEIMESSFFFLK